MTLKERILAFVVPKLKFAGTSGIATAIDYGITFFILDILGIKLSFSYLNINFQLANMIGVGTGMISNFLLQKKFVFSTKRNIYLIFFMTIGFSVASFLLNQWLFSWLRNNFEFLSQHTYISKVIVTGIMFIFNFYTKRFSFERSLPGASQMKR